MVGCLVTMHRVVTAPRRSASIIRLRLIRIMTFGTGAQWFHVVYPI
jgi:hypothetical protein